MTRECQGSLAVGLLKPSAQRLAWLHHLLKLVTGEDGGEAPQNLTQQLAFTCQILNGTWQGIAWLGEKLILRRCRWSVPAPVNQSIATDPPPELLKPETA